MRIYDGEFTIGSILDQCRVSRGDPLRRDARVVDGVNLDQLARIVNRIPVDTIRSRRQRLNAFYEEVLVSADPERGISFTACLMILAHYNVINDSKSLRSVSNCPFCICLLLTPYLGSKSSYDAGYGFSVSKKPFVEIPSLASSILCTGLVNSAVGLMLGDLLG